MTSTHEPDTEIISITFIVKTFIDDQIGTVMIFDAGKTFCILIFIAEGKEYLC